MQFLYKILGSIFRYIYEALVNLGNEPAQVSYYAMALLIMAVIYKLITIPLTIQSAKQTQKAAALQPQIEELKKKYGYDQQIFQKKVQELQKENNATQAGCSGCLMMIVQMVIVIALFQVIRNPQLYLFDSPEQYENIARNFFWMQDLAQPDPTGFVIALLNSATQLGVSMLQQAGQQNNPQMQSTQTMFYILPIVFFFVFRNMPAGLVLYWVAGNIIEIIVKLITRAVSKPEVEVKEV